MSRRALPSSSPPTTAAIWIRCWWQWLTPHPFNFIAKEPLFRNPVFGGFIRLMGAFPTADAKHPDYDMLSEATKRLEKRRHLTIFPEGTRHTDGKVGRGKSGVCVLAARSGKPVVPIGLVFDSNTCTSAAASVSAWASPCTPQITG